MAAAASSVQIIVKFKPGITLKSAETVVVSGGDEALSNLMADVRPEAVSKIFIDKFRHSNPKFDCYYKFEISESDRESFLRDLQQNPNVVWAEPNHAFKIHFTPNDSLFPQQWALDRLKMRQAWELEQGSSTVIVGVIDTGIDYTHEDLQGQLWVNAVEDLNHNGRLDAGDLNDVDDDGNGYIDDVIGWDFTDAPDFPDNGDYLNPDNDPMDEYAGGHGTPVAGVIAAATNNRIGIAGIAPGTRVMALRAGTSSGFLEEDDIAEAVVYAVQNGCKIINMSFGDVVYSHLIKDAVEYGTNRGVLFVCSAGNSGNSQLQYPASYDETISVGAIDENGNLAPFSSYGSKIDLVAPGQEVYSTTLNNTYGKISGTSFSAPMVSAALALLWSADSAGLPQEIKSQLLNGCADLGAAGWDQYFGHGILDVFQSLITGQECVAAITRPQTNSGVWENSVAVTGSALGADMLKYQLSYGFGETPIDLISITQSSNQVVQDTLGIWETENLPDSVYTLELKITKRNLETQVQRVLVQLDRTPARLDSLNILPMLIANYHGYLIGVNTDDQTIATLFYRRLGESHFYNSMTSGYFSSLHDFLLDQNEISGEVEFYLQLQNSSGLLSVFDNNGGYYHLDFNQPNYFNQSLNLLFDQPGFGYFLSQSVDFDGDGTKDAIGYVAWPDQAEPRLAFVNYRNGIFNRYISPIAAFPRDVVDLDGDSHPELIAGFGGTSYIFPGTGLPQNIPNPIASHETDLWVSRIRDLDGDGIFEVLAIEQNDWNLLKLNNWQQFDLTHYQTLANPTAGENTYGVPFSEIGDFDNDGRTDFLIGDYDGDLILYEINSDGLFDPVFSLRLPGEDATYRFAAGDYDGDGEQEVAIATQHRAEYIGESAVDREYWILTVLKSDANNSLQTVWQQNFHGVKDPRNAYSGVSAADYDMDGKDEIFFTPYPRAYYIQFRDGQYRVTWYSGNVNSNAVPDLGDNKVLIAGDSTLMVWNLSADAWQRPIPPTGLAVKAADTSAIELEWEAVPGADEYLVNRLDPITQITVLIETETPGLRDTLVEPFKNYEYRVQTIDSSYTIPTSYPSSQVSAIAENPPDFDGVEVVNSSQLFLNFSRPLGQNSFQASHFWLLPDSLQPTSAVRSRGSRQILLSFLEPLTPGTHQLLFFNLQNASGIPFLNDSLTVPFEIMAQGQPPYLASVEMISKKQLLLSFSQPMDEQSVADTRNYSLDPPDDIVKAEIDASDNSMVHLYLAGKNRMGSLGVSYYLEIRDLKDKQGIPIAEGPGNRVLIQKTVDNLESIVVYPNPLRPSNSKNEITFGNLPSGCEIIIFTANGKKVERLVEEDSDGGVNWNLRNSDGKEVGNGVFIFIARYRDDEKMGKFVIIK